MNFSTIFFFFRNSTSCLVHDVVKSKNVLLLYFVPAFLYCIYNNLAFINLSKFDPTTYYLLLQFRVVITGVLFQVNIREMFLIDYAMCYTDLMLYTIIDLFSDNIP